MGFFDNIAAKLQAMTPEQWAAVKQQAQQRRVDPLSPGTAAPALIGNAVGALAARRGVGPAMTANPAQAGAMVGSTLASLGGRGGGFPVLSPIRDDPRFQAALAQRSAQPDVPFFARPFANDPRMQAALTQRAQPQGGGFQPATGQYWQGMGAQQGQTLPQRVQMRAPTGETQSVSEDQVEHYLRLGAQLVGHGAQRNG